MHTCCGCKDHLRSHAGETSHLKQRKHQQQQTVLLYKLKQCSSTRNLQRGRRVHGEAVESGNDSCIYIANALVNMYAKCGSIAEARQIFDSMKHRDVVSWTTLLFGYADNGDGATALDLYASMKCAPNHMTFVAALKACTSLATNGAARAECLERGRKIHSQIGCHATNKFVQNTLINMYSKCGSIADARLVFDNMKNPDVVSWTAIILGCAENGEGLTSLDLYAKMRSQGCAPDHLAVVAALKACTFLAADPDGIGRAECLERGKQLHAEAGFLSDAYVQNTLIYMYAKCGSMSDARRVFDEMKHPDVVSWNALISGYAENGEAVTALDVFTRMKAQGFTPDCITFVAALKACELLGALESGRKIHVEIDSGTQRDAILVNCLVDFYAKCGSLVEAQDVFDLHAGTRCLTTWTALLTGYSRLGDTQAAFELFGRMQDSGLKPDGVTFLCILTCCSHAGLVEDAVEVFQAMFTKHGLTPGAEHYNCMVDILARSNRLDDALALVHSMPWSSSDVTWMAVLGACHKWKNVELGYLAFRSLVGLDATNAAAYVLLGRIYRSRGMLKEQEMVLTMRNECKAWKEVAQACWTNYGGDVHMFY